MTSAGRDIIRVASIADLPSRSYVQVLKVDDIITVELTDVFGRKVSRAITDQQWAYLLALEGLSRAPVDERAFPRMRGACHYGDQIETYLNGETRFFHASICQGNATRPMQQLAAGINQVALISFPECGSARESAELVRKLTYCSSKILGCFGPEFNDGKHCGPEHCQVELPMLLSGTSQTGSD